jgi:hypothetical protein
MKYGIMRIEVYANFPKGSGWYQYAIFRRDISSSSSNENNNRMKITKPPNIAI